MKIPRFPLPFWFVLIGLTLGSLACAGGTVLPTLAPQVQPTPTVVTTEPAARQDTPAASPTAPAEPSREPTQKPQGAIVSRAEKTRIAALTPSATTMKAPAQASPTPPPVNSLPDGSGPTPTLGPDDWMSLPVVPSGISQQVMLIYKLGLLKGNNPNAYSKVGDCNNILPYFLGSFDQPGAYQLGEYADLQTTIDYFAGSYGRKSLAADPGMTAYSVLSMLWVDQKECKSSETPLTCEFRYNRPMFVILSFGTNDAKTQIDFEKAMRRVIELSIGNGTVPILATKADNAEYDHSLNRTIAALAYEYQLPLWNFWAAVQSLPNQGMNLNDPNHLSVGPDLNSYFDFSGDNLKYGWTMRNLSALQMLDAVRKAVEAQAN
jgi:hypothetical protein